MDSLRSKAKPAVHLTECMLKAEATYVHVCIRVINILTERLSIRLQSVQLRTYFSLYGCIA